MIDKEKAFEILKDLKDDKTPASKTISISNCNFGNSTLLMIVIVLALSAVLFFALS